MIEQAAYACRLGRRVGVGGRHHHALRWQAARALDLLAHFAHEIAALAEQPP